jgi:hypothetical protein
MKYYGKKLGLGLEPSSQGVFVYKKSSLSDIVEISDIVMSINGIDVQSLSYWTVISTIRNACAGEERESVPLCIITFKWLKVKPVSVSTSATGAGTTAAGAMVRPPHTHHPPLTPSRSPKLPKGVNLKHDRFQVCVCYRNKGIYFGTWDTPCFTACAYLLANNALNESNKLNETTTVDVENLLNQICMDVVLVQDSSFKARAKATKMKVQFYRTNQCIWLII